MAHLDRGTDAGTSRSIESGLHVVSLRRTGCREHFITATARAGEAPELVVARALHAARSRDARVVAIDLLGLPLGCPLPELPLRAVTRLGAKEDGVGGGVQIWGVEGPEVTPLELGGRILGAAFADEYARYARLAGVTPSAVTAPRAEQVAETLEHMEAALQPVGLEFHDTVRTWFYNHDILDWYEEFNRARDRFFAEKGVFDRLIPASTGTGGANPQHAALGAAALAIAPHDPGVTIRAVPSPLQCAALDYGSSFSRAIEAAFPDHRRLFVSGTASIDQNGATAFLGDFDAHVHLTFEVVHAILASRGMDWAHVTRGIAYVKHASDVPAFDDYCACAGFDLPLVTVNVDICREDLLFELEVEAITTANRAP